jgi:hypothetical protein
MVVNRRKGRVSKELKAHIFRPVPGLRNSPTESHGLRRGVLSFAPSELDFGKLSGIRLPACPTKRYLFCSPALGYTIFTPCCFHSSSAHDPTTL